MNWMEKVKKTLNNIRAENFWWLEENLFIDDIGLEELGLGADIPKLKTGSVLLSPHFLTEQLLKVFRPSDFDVMVWPGRGARTVKKFLNIQGGVEVFAERVGYGSSVSAQVSGFLVPPEKSVVVLDDVVSSGATALEVFEKGKLSSASLAAWVMQVPRVGSLKCYSDIFAGIVIRGPKVRIPVNSLSTFIEKKEILSGYASRYAEDTKEFIEFFAWLQEEGVTRVV